jgi:hypothetical protein
MTLPSSGPISLSAVNTELGLSATALISLNDTAVRTLAGVASGTISLSNLYGKSNAFAFTIANGTGNANLRTLALAAGWDQVRPVVATINAGSVVSSNSTGIYALTINGAWANGVQLVNNGYIVGKGGDAGSGGNTDSNGGTQGSGTSGSAGGPALLVSVAVSIDNASGVIGGGGGGGGGGGAAYAYAENSNTGNSVTSYSGGGGGGGGAGSGSAGFSGGPSYGDNGATQAASGSNAGALTLGAGGIGGRGFATTFVLNANTAGGDGGNGGSLGTAGSAATSASGSPTGSAGSGGAAGACLSGNVNITWIATGTRYGTIS